MAAKDTRRESDCRTVRPLLVEVQVVKATARRREEGALLQRCRDEEAEVPLALRVGEANLYRISTR